MGVTGDEVNVMFVGSGDRVLVNLVHLLKNLNDVVDLVVSSRA